MKVTANVNKETATVKIEKKDNIFSSKKLIKNIELVHLPYFLFKAEIILKRKTIIQHICVDGLTGEFAFVERENLKLMNDLDEQLVNMVSESQALKIAKNAILSTLMHQKGKGANLISLNLKLENNIMYPYWIGYYKRKDGVDFDVVDAVNGKKQGAKMKPVFIKLIMQ